MIERSCTFRPSTAYIVGNMVLIYSGRLGCYSFSVYSKGGQQSASQDRAESGKSKKWIPLVKWSLWHSEKPNALPFLCSAWEFARPSWLKKVFLQVLLDLAGIYINIAQLVEVCVALFFNLLSPSLLLSVMLLCRRHGCFLRHSLSASGPSALLLPL